MDEHKKVVDITKQWVNDFVIKYNVCPFAKREVLTDRIRVVVSDAQGGENLLENLCAELHYLVEQDGVNTTLLVHPWALKRFEDYNQFLDLADDLLEQQGWLGEFQIASFHPDYQFADTDYNSAENYTNRSPYPMLHVLREQQVEKSIQNYPDIDQIPINNILRMNEIGLSKLQSQLNGFFK